MTSEDDALVVREDGKLRAEMTALPEAVRERDECARRVSNRARGVDAQLARVGHHPARRQASRACFAPGA